MWAPEQALLAVDRARGCVRQVRNGASLTVAPHSGKELLAALNGSYSLLTISRRSLGAAATGFQGQP